jgi:DNA-binding IclR family transcriptional regulator
LGIKCVGSAVFDYTNKVVGALSVIIPLKWFNQENIDRTAEKVIKIATEISSRLGKMGGNER